MSNTEQAQEPTMEEILASIRRIISDDTEEGGEQDVAETAEAAPDPEEAADEEFLAEVEAAFDGEEAEEPEDTNQIDFDALGDEEDEDDDVLELTDVVVEEPAAEEAVDDAGDIEFVDMDEDPALEEEPASEPEPEPAPEISFDVVTEDVSDARIMSEATDGVVSDAFGQLATTLLSRDGTTRTLEELVQEMLRPMLKSWLDENLPPIVENLVRQEIERAARRGGR